MNPVAEQVLDYARGVWRRRLIGLVVAWVIAVGGAIVVFVMPDQYEATARLYVDTQSVLKPLMSGLAVEPNVQQRVGMLSRTLLSRPNMEKLVRMADLDLNAQTQDQKDALIDGLIKNIDLKGGADNLYSIKFRDSSSDQARKVVDGLLSIFVEAGLGGKRKDTEKAQQFISQQIQDYERRLQESERRLKEFKLKNLTAIGGGADALTSMIALEEQLSTAKIELRSAIESRDVIKRELKGEEPVFVPDTLPSGPSSPSEISVPELDTRIETLKKNLDELLRKYTDVHPDVVSTKRVLADLESQRKEQADAKQKARAALGPTDPKKAASLDRNPVFQQLKLSATDAEATVASLSARVKELESRYNQIKTTARMRPEIEEELIQLNRDYQVQKQNYDSLIARRESAMMTSQMEQTTGVADFRVIDPPRVSPKPVAPNRFLLMPVVLALSLVAGIFASFAYSQVFPAVHTSKGLRRLTQFPVLGSLSLQETAPIMRGRKLRSWIFFSGLSGLLAFFAAAFGLLMLMARAA